jgi:hypothetical protein
MQESSLLERVCFKKAKSTGYDEKGAEGHSYHDMDLQIHAFFL